VAFVIESERKVSQRRMRALIAEGRLQTQEVAGTYLIRPHALVSVRIRGKAGRRKRNDNRPGTRWDRCWYGLFSPGISSCNMFYAHATTAERWRVTRFIGEIHRQGEIIEIVRGFSW
jgi:hypothetical protein